MGVFFRSMQPLLFATLVANAAVSCRLGFDIDCTADAHCDDGNPCTADRCMGGSCSYPEVSLPCDDGNACTMDDRCVQGQCTGQPLDADADGYVDAACGGDDCDDSSPAIHPGASEGPPGDASCSDTIDNDCDGSTDDQDPGCTTSDCTSDAQCDDGNPCTEDRCTNGACTHADVEGPCDDGDDCTMGDHCNQGQCVGVPLDADADGYVDAACGGDDCNDFLPGIHPGAAEGPPGDASCSDTVDNDCDGSTDDQDPGCMASEASWLAHIDVPEGEVISLIQRDNGNLLVLAACSDGQPAGACLFELDAGGGLVWQRAYEDTTALTPGQMVETADHGFAVVGTVGLDAFLLVFGNNRALERAGLYGADGTVTEGRALALADDGTLVLAGKLKSSLVSSTDSAWIAKVDPADGQIVWQKQHPDNIVTSWFDAVITTSNGDPVAVGTQRGGGYSNPLLARFSLSDGSSPWQTRGGGAQGFKGWLAVTMLENELVAGGDGTARVSGNGQDWAWFRALGPAGSKVVSLAATTDGNLLAAGRHADSGAWVYRLAATGDSLAWQVAIQPQGATDGTLRAAVQLQGNDIAVGGDGMWVARLTAAGAIEGNCSALVPTSESPADDTYDTVHGASSFFDAALVPANWNPNQRNPGASVTVLCPP